MFKKTIKNIGFYIILYLFCIYFVIRISYLFCKLIAVIIIGLNSKETEHGVSDEEMASGLSYIFGVGDDALNHLVLNKLVDTVKQHTMAGHSRYGTKLNLKEFEPMIWCIGDALNHLPWESIPILNHCKPSICRIPCFEFAALRVMEFGKYTRSRLDHYHIINPKGDLKKTESRFTRYVM